VLMWHRADRRLVHLLLAENIGNGGFRSSGTWSLGVSTTHLIPSPPSHCSSGQHSRSRGPLQRHRRHVDRKIAESSKPECGGCGCSGRPVILPAVLLRDVPHPFPVDFPRSLMGREWRRPARSRGVRDCMDISSYRSAAS